MELGVIRLLAGEARAAGLDPAHDPIPGLRRDVLFTCTADEEAGGLAGARWIADHRPEWFEAAGRPQRVRRRLDDRGRRTALSDPGRGKGLRRLPDRHPRHVGPRLDASPGQRGRAGSRRHRTVGRAWTCPADAGHGALPGRRRGRPSTRAGGRASGAARRRPSPRGCDARCHLRPDVRPGARALLRDTVSPDVVHAGIKYNVIPGRRHGRGRLPRAARHDRTGDAGGTRPADRPGARGGLRDRAHGLRRAGRVTGRGRALRHPRGDDPRPRPGRHPAPR